MSSAGLGDDNRFFCFFFSFILSSSSSSSEEPSSRLFSLLFALSGDVVCSAVDVRSLSVRSSAGDLGEYSLLLSGGLDGDLLGTREDGLGSGERDSASWRFGLLFRDGSTGDRLSRLFFALFGDSSRCFLRRSGCGDGDLSDSDEDGVGSFFAFFFSLVFGAGDGDRDGEDSSLRALERAGFDLGDGLFARFFGGDSAE